MNILLFLRYISFSILFYSIAVSAETNMNPTDLKPNIAILQIVQHPALDATRAGIEDELKKAGYSIQFESAQGNPILAAQIAQKFVGQNVDIMVGIGTTAAQALISANREHKIPIVFCSVTDPIAAHLLKNLKKPEDNVTGISDFIDPKEHFEMIKSIIPHIKNLGIISNPGEVNSIALVKKMKLKASDYSLNLVFATANNSAEVAQATQSLMGKVDGIFINSDNTALSAIDAIVKISTENKIPVFSSDIETVAHGAIAALGPSQYDIGKQTGKIIIEILQGKPVNQLPVKFPEKIELELNINIANEIDLKISDAIIQKAVKIKG